MKVPYILAKYHFQISFPIDSHQSMELLKSHIPAGSRHCKVAKLGSPDSIFQGFDHLP